MLHAWCRRAGCLVHNGTGRRDGRTRCVGKAINAPKVLGIVNGAIEEALAQPEKCRRGQQTVAARLVLLPNAAHL